MSTVTVELKAGPRSYAAPFDFRITSTDRRITRDDLSEEQIEYLRGVSCLAVSPPARKPEEPSTGAWPGPRGFERPLPEASTEVDDPVTDSEVEELLARVGEPVVTKDAELKPFEEKVVTAQSPMPKRVRAVVQKPPEGNG